jgi:cytochrome P450
VPGIPLLGSLWAFRRDAMATFAAGRALGDLVRFRFFHRQGFLISHPDLVKRVLVDDHRLYGKQTRGYNNLRLVVGNGLLTSEGDFWKRQRRITQPAFHHRTIAGFAETMSAATVRMLKGWGTRGDQPVEMEAEMSRLTLEIVGRCLFSTDLSDASDSVGPALTTVLSMAMDRITQVFQVPMHIPTPFNRKVLAAVAELDRVVLGIIETRRRSTDRPADLLTMLLEAKDEDTGESMSDHQLRDELMTLVLAGHETTANALVWTFHLLSEHPEVREKLHAELESALDGRAPTLSDLKQLPYTDAVVKESMRLYPPAWMLGRSANEDLELGGFQIPKGSMIFVSIYHMHRDPRFWKAPDSFRPERFLNGESEDVPKHAYLPFSGGPRVCIGNAFAEMEAKLVVATIAQQVKLDTVKGHVVSPEPLITLRPRRGLPMSMNWRGA